MAITVPDLNQVLEQMGGRLLPLGWWKFLTKARRMDRVRVGFLGVKPEHQHTGVAAALYDEHFDAAERTPAGGRRDGLDPRDQHGHEPRHGRRWAGASSSATASTSACSVAARPRRLRARRLDSAPERARPAMGSEAALHCARVSERRDRGRRRARCSARTASASMPRRAGSRRSRRARSAARCPRSRPPRPPPAASSPGGRARPRPAAPRAPLRSARAGGAGAAAAVRAAAGARVGELLQIVGSRSLLVDVHLLGGPGAERLRPAP